MDVMCLFTEVFSSNPISPSDSGLLHYLRYLDASTTPRFCTEHRDPCQLLVKHDENDDFDCNEDIGDPGDTGNHDSIS